MTRKKDASKTMQQILVEAFDHCQRTAAAHPKEISRLHDLQKQNPKKFCAIFTGLLNHVLPIHKKERSVENIIKFTISFATYEKEKNKHGFKGSPFYYFLIEYLLDLLGAKERGVRLRCCQLLSGLLKHLGSMDQSLYEQYGELMLERTYDKIPDVRVTAVEAIARLQEGEDENCPIVTRLTDMLCYDVSPGVRKKALMEVALTCVSLPGVIGRTRDVKDEIRVEAFRALGQKVALSSLIKEEMQDLIINGLQDRVKAVQNACTDMVMDTWLPSCQNDVEVLLTHFEVDVNDGVVMQDGSPPRGRLAGELVIKALLERWYGEGKGASWNFSPVTEETRMSCERALLWRVHCDFLKEKGEHSAIAHDELEDILPSIPTTCLLLSQHEHPFIAHQFLDIIDMIDMSDEGGRRQLIMIFRAFILSPTLEEGLVGGVMKQLSRAFENEREFVRLVMEILADVREPMDIFMSEEAEVNFAAQANRLIELNDKIVELAEKKDQYIKQERFQAAAKIKEKLDVMEKEFEELRAMEQDREDIEEFVYLRSLSIVEQLLSGTKGGAEKPEVAELLERLLLPAFFQGSSSEVREMGLKCIGIFCLLDSSKAFSYAPIIISALNEEPNIQLTAIHTLFDLLLTYGLSPFQVPPTVPLECEAYASLDFIGSTNVEEMITGALLQHLTITPPLPLSEEEDEVVGVEGRERVQTAVAEGFCKLLFSGVMVSGEILSRLVLMFFDEENKDNPSLHQILSVFFTGFTSYGRGGSVKEQAREALMPSLETLFGQNDASKIIPVFRFFNQMGLAAEKKEEGEEGEKKEDEEFDEFDVSTMKGKEEEEEEKEEKKKDAIKTSDLFARQVSELILSGKCTTAVRTQLLKCLDGLTLDPSNRTNVYYLKGLGKEFREKCRTRAERTLVTKWGEYLKKVEREGLEREEGEGLELSSEEEGEEVGGGEGVSRRLFVGGKEEERKTKKRKEEESEEEKEVEEEEEEVEVEERGKRKRGMPSPSSPQSKTKRGRGETAGGGRERERGKGRGRGRGKETTPERVAPTSPSTPSFLSSPVSPITSPSPSPPPRKKPTTTKGRKTKPTTTTTTTKKPTRKRKTAMDEIEDLLSSSDDLPAAPPPRRKPSSSSSSRKKNIEVAVQAEISAILSESDSENHTNLSEKEGRRGRKKGKGAATGRGKGANGKVRGVQNGKGVGKKKVLSRVEEIGDDEFSAFLEDSD